TPKKEQDTLKNWLKKNPKNNKSTAFDRECDGSKYAVLHYQIIKKMDNYSLLEIDLETGRHHQIRCQLAKIGYPIKGDLKYGFPRSNKGGSIHLHARKINFIHPVSKIKINVIAPTPNDVLWNA
ncbi:MAG: RNA pseudouridine synthase, partial [Polaribacter sp.]